MDLHLIAEHLLGTCKLADDAIDRFDLLIEAGELEDALVGISVEICPHCGWWMESSALVDESGDVVGCDQCRTEWR